MFSKKRQLRKLNTGGFSLLEVLVTSAIIGIITAVVVIRYGAFNSTILLKNQAYEVALAYREAQVNSLSTRGESGVSDPFKHAYGIAITMGNDQQIVLFLDGNDNGVYDYASPDIEVEILRLDSRFKIEEFCANAACSSPTLNKLSVVFDRPDFDAKIQPENAGGPVGSGYTEAVITLGSVDSISIQRKVTVSSTGQISVQ